MNCVSAGRTSYFDVKDRAEFLRWVKETREKLDLEAASSSRLDDSVRFCLLFENGVPSFFYNEETDEEVDWSLAEELTPLLAPGQVVTVMENHAEGLRYLGGNAWAFCDKGEVQVSLWHALQQEAKDKLGLDDLPPCAY